ncbi:MAG: glycerol dehydratase reactivase beta/small subunit family protein [Clostridia bacterium]|nr:glycerol dehydratase reactivase beta/small subunit family protein [Clostridia bacterium]
MIVKRPSIFVYTNRHDDIMLKEICAGIEEEGVFFEVFEKDFQDLATLSFDAANESMMGSGIGISRGSVALAMKGVQKGKFVEYYDKPTHEECRKIGANSARIIKKMPLK